MIPVYFGVKKEGKTIQQETQNLAFWPKKKTEQHIELDIFEELFLSSTLDLSVVVVSIFNNICYVILYNRPLNLVMNVVNHNQQ